MLSAYRIAPIRPEDVDAVRDLQRTAWASQSAKLPTTEKIDGPGALIAEPDEADTLLSHHLILAWTRDTKILHGSAGWFSDPKDRKCAYIRKVLVHPDAAGIRLGRALVLRVEALARRTGKTKFSVRAHARAERFYQNLGYRTVARDAVKIGQVELTVLTMEKSA